MVFLKEDRFNATPEGPAAGSIFGSFAEGRHETFVLRRKRRLQPLHRRRTAEGVLRPESGGGGAGEARKIDKKRKRRKEEKKQGASLEVARAKCDVVFLKSLI
jgi:hypothetical protein